MKNIFRKSIVLLPVIFSGLFLSAQDITGVWKGTLHVQTKEFPIVFHIGRDSAGKFIATFDSPSQNAFNIAVSDVITKEDSVILMMSIINGKYAGILGQDKKTIEGSWFQGGGSFPLSVTKTSDTATVKQQRRPQTPRPPFAYQTREVEYWNGDKSVHFGGTLTWPIEDKAHPAKIFPAIILITGSH